MQASKEIQDKVEISQAAQDLYTEEQAREEAIIARFENATDKRSQWLKMRVRGDWEREDRPEDTPSFWRRMFGVSQRKSKDED